jgi:hypothetical protein
VEADRFEWPAFDQGSSFRFERVPEVADEVEEPTAAGLLAPKLGEVTGDLFLFLFDPLFGDQFVEQEGRGFQIQASSCSRRKQ